MVETNDVMVMEIEGHPFTIEAQFNKTVDALKAILKTQPITVVLQDYANIEKCGRLKLRLPKDERIYQVHLGDVAIHMDDQLVIYYRTNTYTMSPIGRISNDMQLLENLLRSKRVINVRLSMVKPQSTV